MSLRKSKSSRLAVLVSLAGILLWGCAQQSSPTGGEKDLIPPKVVRIVPENQTINFKGRVVELEFDEYINIDNLNQQLLITPAIEGTFDFKTYPKGVRITFDQDFRANTTYTLNFRNAFKDVTERNPARNVKLVFSTGPQLDSLRLQGTVKELLTDKPVFDALVGLYQQSDTLKFSKNKPYYLTKTDSSGRFDLENMSPGQYRLAALKDVNNNLFYNTDKDLIGFHPNPITLPGFTGSPELKITAANLSPQRTPKTVATSRIFSLVYPRGVQGVQVQFERKEDSLTYALIEPNQLRFYNILNTTDTVRATITVQDSLSRDFTHTQKIKFRERGKRDADTRESMEVKVSPKTGEDQEQLFQVTIDFSKPITQFNPLRVEIQEDTIRRVMFSANDYQWNPYRTQLKIEKELKFRRDVRSIFPKGTFISIEGDTAQAIRLLNPLRDPEKYGTISGEVRNIQSDFIVELLSAADYKVVRSLRNQTPYTFKSVPAGTYRLRLVLDINKNGRWDAGNPDAFVPPETVILFPSEIKLKANFELLGNDFTLQ
ncbi:Ig-like domain-containing domain [Siphonobacter sp.]|uniref:Ig-like domain-containing domain n=1 Tax=Siphonobacter sp. TaxID=1869184 RepID=UPI003B3A8BED